jgi:hypothetical protein
VHSFCICAAKEIPAARICSVLVYDNCGGGGGGVIPLEGEGGVG